MLDLSPFLRVFMTIIHVTENQNQLEETLSEMMDVSLTKALSIEVLIKAVMRLPVRTTIHYDKIYGRWIFSNQDEDQWPRVIKKAHIIAGANFTFVDEVLETALARGIYYFYHTKVKP